MTSQAVLDEIDADLDMGRRELLRLLEVDSFVALEARCGEMHGRLIDFPHDERLQALYDGCAAAWLLCRGL